MRATKHYLQLVKEETKAALTNEQITRKRVDELEEWAKAASRILAGSFWARVWWLIHG